MPLGPNSAWRSVIGELPTVTTMPWSTAPLTRSWKAALPGWPMISMQSGLAATASLNWLIMVSGAQAENCSLRSTPKAAAACAGAGLAGEGGAVAGVAAHLHVHGQAVADHLGRGGAGIGEHRDGGGAGEKFLVSFMSRSLPFYASPVTARGCRRGSAGSPRYRRLRRRIPSEPHAREEGARGAGARPCRGRR